MPSHLAAKISHIQCPTKDIEKRILTVVTETLHVTSSMLH